MSAAPSIVGIITSVSTIGADEVFSKLERREVAGVQAPQQLAAGVHGRHNAFEVSTHQASATNVMETPPQRNEREIVGLCQFPTRQYR